MAVLMKILQVILALSLLIIIHEAGHFTFAKIFGIRVEKFFLFFDAGGFRLFSTKGKFFTRLFPKAASWETEYGIGWLPLGGYCKIAGMIDESMDLEGMKREPQPWEFRTHPAWQRLLVMAGGVINNFIFAVLAFVIIVYAWGTSYIPNDGNAVYVNELAEEMGFRTGDRILSFDDYAPEDFSMLQIDLARRNVRKATVLREGDTLDVYIDQSLIGAVIGSPGMFDLAVPFVVDSLMTDSPNAGVDIRHGDRILTLDGTPVPYLQDSRPVLQARAGATVDATMLRDADTLSVQLQVDTAGRIGVYLVMPEVVRREYSFWQSVPAGAKMTWESVAGYVRDLRLVFTPRTKAYKSVGSFIAIGQVFPSTWNSYQFLYLLAILSIMLGVMNLLPIPALDGGHIVICLFEMLTGRKPGDKFLAVTQVIGMILLLALMVLAFGNDIARLIH